MIRNRRTARRSLRQRSLTEELETQRTINFFALSLLAQPDVDALLWDVAKNCIARLHFTDCVVYWLDTERNVLVQKAAHGTKNPAAFAILNPIEIPLGKGIVGSVALNQQPEIVADTSLDERYIRDYGISPCYSEIAVPIVCNGKVVGIIDAEHPEKDFFQSRHLNILTAIAQICAQKIRRVEIEQAYQQAERQLLDTNRRIAETKLMALRMQMNPHFVFNSLSSINNFILQNNSEQASEYLTKFSRLMRQVMVNTQTEWVSLRQELKALQVYIELEQLRCDNCFAFALTVGDGLPLDGVQVPPLLLQPYIDNAIRHGLLNQTTSPVTLSIDCAAQDGYLRIRITDTGIGRSAAAQLQTRTLTAHRTFSHGVTDERLRIVNEIYGVDALIRIDDLTAADGQPMGTCVTFTQKLKKA